MLKTLWRKWRQRRWWVRWIVYAVLPIVLFYLVEDLRGWWAWRTYRKAAEVRGERFELEHHLPGPIPDEENFAATPFIRELYRKEGDFDPPAEVGSPFWDPPGYDEASGVHRELCRIFPLEACYPEGKFSRAEAARQVEIDLEPWEPIFLELAEAVRRPACDFPMELEEEGWGTRIHHLTVWTKTNRALHLRATARIESGDSVGALTDIETVLGLNWHAAAEGRMVSETIRIGLIALSLQPVWEGLRSRVWDDDSELRRLHRIFAAFDLPEDFSRCLLVDRGVNILELDRLAGSPFRRHRFLSTLGYFTTAPRFFLPEGNETVEAVDEMLSQAVLTIGPRGWYWQNKRDLCRATDSSATPSSKPFFPGPRITPYNFLSRQFEFVDVSSSIFTNTLEVQTNCELALVAIALERFRLAHGTYPSALARLTPEFLDSVPADRYASKPAPLRYQRRSADEIALWSVGPNGTDEGGRPHQNKDQGDITWQYSLPPNFTVEDFRK